MSGLQDPYSFLLVSQVRKPLPMSLPPPVPGRPLCVEGCVALSNGYRLSSPIYLGPLAGLQNQPKVSVHSGFSQL